ncbi:hypothetical protein BGX23_007959 [Mortierella sp. AD031]|nr:hypothetical protein BGX23_007959 [Mortierella sp. AD031]KAG0203432.1 hypothetical protein BGX33_009126 [Mortierella sp. NVP41]
MGNVSSADNDRVNELLTRRAKKKLADRNKLKQQQQQQQQQPHDPYLPSSNNDSSFHSNGINSTPVHPMLRQKSVAKCHPLDQAEFYGAASSSEWSGISHSTGSHSISNGTTSTTTRHSDYPPQSPASPSFSIPSSATTPTSASYNIDGPYLSSRFEDRHLDPVPALPSSPQQRRPPPVGSQFFPENNNSNTNTTPSHQYHTLPIVIPQHRYSQLSISSLDDGALNSRGPSYQPPRRGSEHHILHHQQQQQLSADLRLLGTSPEAKDWLKQKPTRSSTHMIHQYNFHPHQYYQQPGSITVKVVNNTCRNMGDYPNAPSLPSLNARPSGPYSSGSNGRSRSYSSKGSASSTVPSLPNGSTSAPSGAAATAAIHGAGGGHRPTYVSEPIPNPSARARGMSQPEMTGGRSTGAHDASPAATSNEAHAHLAQGPRPTGRLIMSRSKLVSPLAASLPSSSTGSLTISVGAPLGSPVEPTTAIEDSHFGPGYESSHPIPVVPRTGGRPSSTLSSLRSLLGNHPQGLSLIESLEEEEDNDLDSLSDTETGDSEGDLIQRTESLLVSESHGGSSSNNNIINNNYNNNNNNKEKKSSRRRPPPQFEWMAARRRFSSSSISTISRDIQDSQKGQHALWKYIGGGNSHAPLRYDIDRILDSGCGLGEWTMEMAKEFPNATVYGIDINPELFPSVHQAVPSNCLFSPSNLLTRLSFPNQYFDFVYQRFLYLGLTIDDWPVALKELRRVMKPGGWIELFEPCMRVHRAGARTREVMRWCSRLLQEERGLDFDFAGEKMKRLCESEEIGFQNVKLERLSIPVGAWGGRVGQAMAENMVLIFQNLQSALIPADLTPSLDGSSMKAFDLMVQSWIRECEENKSYIDYYILIGQKPLEKEA